MAYFCITTHRCYPQPEGQDLSLGVGVCVIIIALDDQTGRPPGESRLKSETNETLWAAAGGQVLTQPESGAGQFELNKKG